MGLLSRLYSIMDVTDIDIMDDTAMENKNQTSIHCHSGKLHGVDGHLVHDRHQQLAKLHELQVVLFGEALSLVNRPHLLLEVVLHLIQHAHCSHLVQLELLHALPDVSHQLRLQLQSTVEMEKLLLVRLDCWSERRTSHIERLDRHSWVVPW